MANQDPLEMIMDAAESYANTIEMYDNYQTHHYQEAAEIRAAVALVRKNAALPIAVLIQIRDSGDG